MSKREYKALQEHKEGLLDRRAERAKELLGADETYKTLTQAIKLIEKRQKRLWLQDAAAETRGLK